MDQYLICLLNNSLSDKDQTVIKKYLSHLFPTPFQTQYAEEYIESIATLLKPSSVYIAVINTRKENKNIIWKLLDEDENILNIIESDVTKTDSAFEFDSQDATDYISASIHSLADQLPEFGTYRLDILVGTDVLRELTISKEPILAGTFIRLTRWHSAHFTIFEQKEFDTDRLNEWCEIINSQILLQNSKLDLGPSLWRGSVQFWSSNNKNETLKGFQLRLDLDDHDHDHNFFSSVKGISKHQISENVILSSKLQVIDEVSFTSIPPYFISPLAFRLCFNRQNILNENSSSFIEYLHNNEKTAFIAKLGYAEVKEKSKAERKYCSSRWQKVAFLGEIKDSECFVSSFEKCITFAITKSNCSDYVVAYPLQDPANLDASFYFKIINHRVQNEQDKVFEEDANISVPIISESVYEDILHQYSKQIINSKNGFNNSMFKVDSSSVLKNINILSSCSEYEKAHSTNFCVEEIDPSDWPERIQLLHKQMKNEEDCHSTNMPVIQNLKLPQQSFSLTSKSIAEHFLPSGEHKNSDNLEEIYSTNHTDYLVTCSLDDVFQSEWPGIVNFIYHDLYYNSNNRVEDKECLGSQLVNLYIQNETATTCNNQQLAQNFHILVSEKISSPSKAFRGPSARITSTSNENRPIKDNPSPRAKTLRELISRKILSTSTMNTKKPNEVRRASHEISKKSLGNKNIGPVRCSPRKKSPVDYRYPSVNRNNISKKNDESNKIPDLLRKKLRYAVAKALEENGITSTHPMYQPCGSKLLNICRTFLDDLKLKKGKTSEYLQKIADAHVKQVIEFYKD